MYRFLAAALVASVPAGALSPARSPPLRTHSALQSSPLDGLFGAFKSAFENDAEYAPEKAEVRESTPVDGDWTVELSIVGVPTKDPSSDLFGPRTRITDENKGISAAEMSATLRLRDGVCDVVEASEPLFADAPGAYRTKDGELKIKLECTGFTRTFTTTGSLQSVFGGEGTSRTSSVYKVPAGPLILQGATEVMKSSGETYVKKGTIFCVEEAGLFGAASKTSPAGRWSATTRTPLS